MQNYYMSTENKTANQSEPLVHKQQNRTLCLIFLGGHLYNKM
jgi:hypothetical protein